ncbi:MAG: NAD-dependent deacetylase [Methanosaeta sp. PtaU1.Bin028]|nr:MAG: NAD-dependent deacetylase [Methanosaeta sp. PtaU1.Bin028]
MISIRSDPEGWLKEALTAPEKKLAFFVGAGISVASGLPNFLKFDRDILSHICPSNLEKGDIDKISKRLRPEVLLQIVEQVHGDRTLDFYSNLESNKPNANHFFLASALKAGHCVFTTNVDILIEQACKEIGFECHPIVYEDEYEQFLNGRHEGNASIDVSSQLFKLHGSIESDKAGLERYRSIRFVLDRVGLGLAENQERILLSCLQDYDFVFLGYSGNDHFSVLPVLLKVDSDQTIYWFKFEKDQMEFKPNDDIKYFQNRKSDLLEKASEGITSEVDWEEISIMEVLSEREKSILVIGNSSYIIKEILKQVHRRDYPEVQRKEFVAPAWIKDLTDFERHLLAAALLIRMRDISNLTEDQLKKAEKCAKNEKERAEVERLRASTFSVGRRLGYIKASKNDLLEAISRLEDKGEIISSIEAHLELANLFRIDRSFESAKEELEKADKLLKENKSDFQQQKRSYDWPRLMAQLYHHRGLIYGLGRRGTMADKLKAINYCDEAHDYAKQAGDVSRSAAILNARGLIIYQLAERSGSLLKEAESSLDNAFALWIRIGDPRTSFQPLRNLLLVHILRALRSKLHTRRYWLDIAQRDCARAGNYLKLMNLGSGEVSAESIEVRYRQAQIYGLKGDIDKARSLFKEVLAYWQEKNDLHQQARIWQDLLLLAEDWEFPICIRHLLSLIESIFQSEKECARYENDILRLENIRDMLIDAYLWSLEYNAYEYLDKIAVLMRQGGEIAEKFRERDLSTEFKVWSSKHRE